MDQKELSKRKPTRLRRAELCCAMGVLLIRFGAREARTYSAGEG